MTISNTEPVAYEANEDRDDLEHAIAQLVMAEAVDRFGEVIGTPRWWEK